MSEAWGQQGDATAVAAPDGPSAGAMLRQAREATGLHIAALAVALKVPVRKLEALEDDRYDLMTDSVFVRGLAASVCRTLKIDPQPILERLPQTTAPRLLRDNEGINAPFRAPSDGPPANWAKRLTKPVYLIVFALLFGALAVVFFPQTIHDGAVVSVSAPTAPVAPAAMASTSAQASSDVQVPIAAAATPPAPANVTPVSPTPLPAAVPAPVATVAAAPLAIAAKPATETASGALVPSATGVLVVRATGASWVEITDAKGTSPVRKILAAGESVVANGPLPIRVVVGRSDLTQVLVRGKPFDLKPYTRADNLARFDVK